MPAILDEQYNVVEFIAVDPECGEDFCDRCGDCLACYGNDPCWDGGEEPGTHSWFVYAEDVVAFKARLAE